MPIGARIRAQDRPNTACFVAAENPGRVVEKILKGG